MALYGVDEYGKALYGADLDIDYTVANLAAVQCDYGRVTLSWSAPPLSDWTSLTLVRSSYGYPVAVTDGVRLGSWPVGGAATSYDDVGLSPGYWYYTLFLAAPFTAWSAAATYVAGDRVGYGGSVWYCLAPDAAAVAPGTDPAVWVATSEAAMYRPAGSVAALSVRDYGYGALLDALVPPPYKSAPSASTDTAAQDSDLTQFMGVLGFAFAQINTELDDLLEVYDVTTTRQDRLYRIGATLGITGESGASARMQRLRTLRAAAVNQQRGTQDGIAALIRAATGLGARVSTGANLMLSQNQSAFHDPAPVPWDPAAPYQLGDHVLYRGVRYVCSGFSLAVTTATYASLGVSGAPSALSVVSGAVKEASASAPATMTVPFTAAFGGSYSATFTLDAGPDLGILTALVDGSSVQVSQVITAVGLGRPQHTDYNWVSAQDAYAGSLSTNAYRMATKPRALSPGAHTLTLKCAAKNTGSSGYGIAAVSLTLTGSPLLFAPGNPPTGAANSAAQWSVPSTGNDTGTYANPVTGGMGTWNPLTGANLATGYLGA